MKYKVFNKMPDLRISVVGLGCWSFGGTWNGTEDQKSIETIRTALDNGVNFLDTAPVYGLGHSEKIVGEAIKGYDRDKLVIASKCGLVWDENNNVTNNLTKESIFQEIEQSLERLGIDYIDLYQIHWPDNGTALAETMEALNELKKLGKIKYIGVSNFSLDRTKEAMKYSELATHQGLYNMLEQNPSHYHGIELEYKAKDEILPFCCQNGMAYLPYSPLMQGLLTGSFKLENNFDENDDRFNNSKLKGEELRKNLEIVDKLTEVAKKINKPLPQLAINWLIDQGVVGPVICGAQTPEQMLQNIQSADWSINSDIRDEIDAILKNPNVE